MVDLYDQHASIILPLTCPHRANLSLPQKQLLVPPGLHRLQQENLGQVLVITANREVMSLGVEDNAVVGDGEVGASRKHLLQAPKSRFYHEIQFRRSDRIPGVAIGKGLVLMLALLLLVSTCKAVLKRANANSMCLLHKHVSQAP